MPPLGRVDGVEAGAGRELGAGIGRDVGADGAGSVLLGAGIGRVDGAWFGAGRVVGVGRELLGSRSY